MASAERVAGDRGGVVQLEWVAPPSAASFIVVRGTNMFGDARRRRPTIGASRFRYAHAIRRRRSTGVGWPAVLRLVALDCDLTRACTHLGGVVPCLHLQEQVHADIEGFLDA